MDNIREEKLTHEAISIQFIAGSIGVDFIVRIQR